MHHSGITDLSRTKKKNKQQKKNNLLLYFGWRSKQQQVFAHSLFTKEKGAHAQKSLVPLEQPNFQQSGGTRCCTRYSRLRATGNSDRRQAFSSASPDDTANVVCLSLARRQTAAWAGSWPTGMVQVAPTEAQLAVCSLDRYRKNPAVLIYL